MADVWATVTELDAAMQERLAGVLGVPQAPSTPGGASQEPISPHEEAKTTPETVAEKLSDVRTEPLP
jgi:hypothetical protein